MKKVLSIICLVVFVCAMTFTLAWAAEEKAPEPKQEKAKALTAKEQAEYAKKVDLFQNVVTYAEAQKDPLVMLSAVKMLDGMPFGGIAKPGTDEKKPALYDRLAMLDQAKQFAEGDTEVLAVIAKAQTAPEKTDVRWGGRHGGYGGHGGWGGHRGGPGWYYGPPRHHRGWGCVWFTRCHPYRGCTRVCR